MKIQNIAYIRSLHSPDFPDLGAKLAEALQSIARQATNLEQQTNSNPAGEPQAPPTPNSLQVTGQNGHFNIAIKDNSAIYRGINYWVEHADNPHFTNPVIVPLGQSRNANLFLGNVSRYWRAYSSYSSSPPSDPVYHGTQGQPHLVNGGGSVGGPDFLPSESSGTGTAGQGLQGPGVAPFRSPTGVPPVR